MNKLKMILDDSVFLVLDLEENNSQASLILKCLIEKNIDYVKNNCEFLYEYYKYIY